MTGLTDSNSSTVSHASKQAPVRRGIFGGRPNVTLGRILGIPIFLDYSWFLIVALLTWLLSASYFPGEYKNWSPITYWLTGAASTLLLFASVLLHELGHSVVAIHFKIPVRSITLFIFGGVARIGAEPPSARAEFLIAIAGPVTSFLLAIACTVIQPALVTVEPLLAMAAYLAFLNFALAVFNLIPGYPLDGGRVFRSLVWVLTKDMRRATVIAGNVGRLFGFLFILFGVWRVLSGDLGGLWIAFIGWFLENAASAQVSQAVSRRLLEGHFVSQAMSTQCATVSASASLQDVVDDHVLGTGKRCFLVNRGADTVGLMTIHRIKAVDRSQWSSTTAAETMLPLDELRRTVPTAELWAALQDMDRDGVNQLPVMTDHRVVGMLSREDVLSYLRTAQEIGV